MKQSQAVAYLLLHFAKRVKSNRRDSILASKQVRVRSVASYISSEAFYGYVTLKSLDVHKDERKLIEHLCSFISEQDIRVGTFIHCAEIIVREHDYPIEDLKLLQYAGECMNLSADQANTILHLILCRESLVGMEKKELWLD